MSNCGGSGGSPPPPATSSSPAPEIDNEIPDGVIDGAAEVIEAVAVGGGQAADTGKKAGCSCC